MSAQKTAWYLRKPDGSEYGPVTTDDLLRWARQCRIVAGNGVSSDRENWIPVEDIPELEMEWTAIRPNGNEYGPFNIGAVKELLGHKVVAEDTVLTHKSTHKSVTVAQVLNEDEIFTEEKSEVDDNKSVKDNELSEAARREEERYAEAEAAKADGNVPAESAASSQKRSSSPKKDKSPPENEAVSQVANENIAEIEALKDEIAQSRKKVKSLEKELKKAEIEIETLRSDGAAAEECGQKLDKALQQLKQQKKMVNELKRELAEANTELGQQAEDFAAKQEKSVAARQRLEQEVTQLRSLLKEQEQDITDSVSELRREAAFMKRNNATLRSDLEKVRRIADRRGRQIVSILVAMALLTTFVFLTGRPGCSHRGTSKSAKQHTDTSETSELPDDQVSDTVEESSSTNSEQTERPTGSTSRDEHVSVAMAWPKFLIEGVKAVPAARSCVIYFDSGVFSSLVTPTSEAKQQLHEIAAILRPLMGEVKVIVEGYTDDRPLRKTSAYDGNDALALARAEVVRKLLITDGKLPANSVSARHSGGRKAPYPNNTESNRRRNRTVVLRLIKK